MSKKILFITLTAIVLWCFAYSCAKQNDYDGYVETTTERFSTVDEQVAYLEGLLATLDAEKVVLADYADSLAGAGDARAEVVDSLLEDLDGKMHVVEDTLKQYATKRWADATFATINAVKKLSVTTAELAVKVKADSSAIAANITNSITASEDSLKKMFESYYTRAEVDAMIGTLTTRLKNLSDSVSTAKDSVVILEEEVAGLKEKYGDFSKALDAAIDELKKQDTVFMSEIERIDTTFSSRFDSLGDVVAANKAKLDELTGRIAKLEARVQSVEVVPDYIDGSVKMMNLNTKIKFEVRPFSAAQALVAKGASAFSLQVMKVKAVTKASIYNTVTVLSASVDTVDALLVLKVKGSDMPGDFFDTTAAHQCYSARLTINDGNTGKSTPYFPLTPYIVSYPEAPELECVEINGTIWAPVNCGYEPATTTPSYKGYPYGKLYQWGRKYGQGYDANDATYPNSGAGTLKNEQLSTVADGSKVDNKDNFYYGEDWTCWTSSSATGTDDWFTTYNPCPEGWRVPTAEELKSLIGGVESIGSVGWDATKKGYWFNGTTSPTPGNGLFFPAAGYRNGEDGKVYSSRGARCYYWSSSVDKNYAWLLEFEYGQTKIKSYCRAVGHSVRCVYEPEE